MEYNCDALRNDIEAYLDGALRKDDLIFRIRSAYSDFLTKSFPQIEKMCVYPFLRRIDAAYEEDAESGENTEFFKSEINLVYDILNGTKNRMPQPLRRRYL